MKTILTLIFTISSIISFAGLKSKTVPMYQVISDSIDPEIPSGKCLITGIITKDGQVINEALIYTEDGTKVNSNKIGEFKIFVDTSQTYLVIHKTPYRDAYVEYLKFENQHHIHLKIFIPEKEVMIMKEKPVIYAYAPEQMDVNIKIITSEDFTFTYPQISNVGTWDFTTQTTGNILLDKKEYPYLFWESESEEINYTKNEAVISGNIIKDELVVSFLEEHLSILGLNDKEKTDFITYWAPRMIQHKYSLIQFMLDEDYDKIAKIEVTPTPKSMRRVYMVFTSFDDYPSQYNIKTQTLTPSKIDRSGLTIIEWGGSEIPQSKLNEQL